MWDALNKSIDFTRGSIIKQMALFTLPIAAGELLQNLYSSVDALVVGNLVGDTALAAVSVSLPLVDLVIGFFNGMSAGASVVVSQKFGEGDPEKLCISMRASFSFAAIFGVFLSFAGVILAPSLLHFTSVNSDIYAEAVGYLRIYLAGIMFTVIYNICAGIMRAVGNSKTPFVILILSCCTNIILDILFVKTFHLGIIGVGIATVMSQFLSVSLAYRKLQKTYNSFRFSLKEIVNSKNTIAQILKIGLPAGLQNSLISFSTLFTWRYINSFNSANITAGVGVAIRIDRFVSLPSKAIGLTMTTFIAQNVGAQNYKRSREGILKGYGLSLSIVAVLSVIVFTFAPFFASLFNDNTEVLAVATNMIRTVVTLYALLATRETFLGTLRGYGDSKIPMLLSLISMIGIRQAFLAFMMHYSPAVEVVYWSFPVGWASNALLLAIYYLCVRSRYIDCPSG